MEVIAAHRKLIDIDQSAFATLSVEAKGRNMSLKKYIEMLLEEESARIRKKKSIKASPRILALVGSAKPIGKDVSSIDDDRLQYLLSK